MPPKTAALRAMLHPGGACECGTLTPREPYCPRHKYRWEYEQDEQEAHKVLDDLGAPRADDGEAYYSVAGRILALDTQRKRWWWRRG
jgi:hypothetical protein